MDFILLIHVLPNLSIGCGGLDCCVGIGSSSGCCLTLAAKTLSIEFYIATTPTRSITILKL